MSKFAIIFAVALAIFAPIQAFAQTAAVVLMYHRFGEAKYPSTNIDLVQFDAHLTYLRNNRFNVVSLADIAAALKSGMALPPKTVAITIDDAYASVVREAWPRLKRAGYPFTVFVATAAVDNRETGIMSWDDVRALAAGGATIGAHSHTHAHYPSLSATGVAADIAKMKDRFKTELGVVPEMFAFPYGEAGDADMALVAEAGFKIAFGQHSGAAYNEGNVFYVPRFALNENYGRMDRFALAVSVNPLRAVNIVPANPVLAANPPRIEFDVIDPPRGLADVSCFTGGGDKLPTSVNGARVEIVPAAAYPVGRARANCTLRSAGQWYWFGYQMIAGGVSEGIEVHGRYPLAR
ncbi:MAG: polysaccharide deacetylase family protein [Rhodobacteraceae bacterium]|nr:polysaccharide deacetylase family protein [Paracoccaceae bacterium]